MDFINEDMKFIAVDDQGNEVECEVLFTFDNEDTGKSYIVYTDNLKDELGRFHVLANIYDPEDDGFGLAPIETEEEWEMVAKMLERMKDMVENEEE